MKIYQTYETDKVAEVEGEWVDIGDGARIKVARFGNPTHEKVLEKLRRPYRNITRTGRDLPGDVQQKIAIESMAEAILLDWENIEDEAGNPILYARETAARLLTDLKDFRETVAFLAMEAATFRKEALQDDAKNSESSSDGA